METKHGGVDLSPPLDDATRDACLHALGDHYAAGRISADELDRRVATALAARVEDELVVLTADLTEDPGQAPVPADDPAEPRRRGSRLDALRALVRRPPRELPDRAEQGPDPVPAPAAASAPDPVADEEEAPRFPIFQDGVHPAPAAPPEPDPQPAPPAGRPTGGRPGWVPGQRKSPE